MSNTDIARCCEVCRADCVELFGYRNRDDETWRWFCAAHRIGRYFADARRWPMQAEDDL